MRKTVKYKGVDVVYSHSGSGEAIILIHGFLEERSMWTHYAETLSKTNTVICPDLLGQGETGCLGYIHSIKTQAEAVSAVLEQEQITKFALVGHSMGGYVALHLGQTHPEKTSKLMLLHSTALPDSEERKIDRERVIKLVERNKDVYINAVIPTLFADQDKNNFSKEIAEIARIAQSFSKQGIIANIRGMKDRSSYTGVLHNTGFPKLIIHGVLDNVISTKDIKIQSTEGNNLRVEKLPEIGHMGHIEAPGLCLKLITEFCFGN